MHLPAAVVVVLSAILIAAAAGQGLNSRADLAGLYSLRASLGLRARDWPARSDPCTSWAGVTCLSGRVFAVRLSGLRRTRLGSLRPGFAVDGLQNLTSLAVFNASGFSLPGQIPAWFGRRLPPSLAVLDLRSTEINGTLPSNLGLLGNLTKLVLANNELSGRLPESFLSLQALQLLDLSANNLTGELPNVSALAGNVSSLVFNISGNSFYGAIGGGAIGALKKRFGIVDVSGNYFDGVVGSGNALNRTVAVAMNCFSDAANQRSRAECEAFYKRNGVRPAEIPVPSPSPEPPAAWPASGKRSRKWKYVLAGVLAGAALLVVVFLVALVLCLMRRRRGRGRQRGENAVRTVRRRGSSVNAVASSPVAVSPEAPTTPKNPAAVVDEFTYEQLLHATGGFGDDNLLKHGHTGDIYHGVLENGDHVVVKKVDAKSVKKDAGELALFAKASHARLVPLLGHLAKDEQDELLVYKYMLKGDLTNALHKKPGDTDEGLPSLDWITRLKIAIGVAEALCFLHDECSPPLVHRDVQASSVLLDDKFEVRLGSLSEICTQQGEGSQNVLSRILRSSKSLDKKNTSGPPATCSYDVYCFGKVLLELVTGNFSVSGSNDAASEEWLASTVGHINPYDKESVAKIVDPSLVVDEDHLEEVWAVGIVAKTCLNSKPSRRPPARYVLKALENPLRVVREEFRSNSARLRSTSSRSSWRSAFHGNWPQSTSEMLSTTEQMLVRKHSVKSQGSGGEHSFSFKRASREIVPEPLGLEDDAVV